MVIFAFLTGIAIVVRKFDKFVFFYCKYLKEKRPICKYINTIIPLRIVF